MNTALSKHETELADRSPLNSVLSAKKVLARRSRASAPVATVPVLATDASAALRERLLAELAAIYSNEMIDRWAHRSLSAKNRLSVPDAQLIEKTFQERLAEIGEVGLHGATQSSDAPNVTASSSPHSESLSRGTDSEIAGDTVLATAVASRRNTPIAQKTVRLRDKEHRKFVAAQPCLVCGRSPADPHHVRFAQPRALGRKVSDEYTVPVCRAHHRELHTHGDEKQWWRKLNLNPLPIALKLWNESHAVPPIDALEFDLHNRPNDGSHQSSRQTHSLEDNARDDLTAD